jgi:hypothetical protein
MFCHHHDEAEVYGTEPVPCPFCGLGGGQDLAIDAGPDTEDFEDSNEALRHALFEEPSSPSSGPHVHW